MDEQYTDVLKRLGQIEQQLSDMDRRFESIESQLAGNTVSLKEKKPKGKLFLFICIPILLLCLLAGCYFAFLANRKPSYEKAKIGDIVTFGKFEQNNSEADGPEPIEWIVMDKQDGRILLLSRHNLYTELFGRDNLAGSWRDSTVRKSLNVSFISLAFSPQEQEKICPREFEEAKVLFSDKVFLLSEDEIESFFPTRESRKAMPTETCISKSNTLDNAQKWWTRSVTDDYGYLYVTADGEILATKTDNPLGIRPVLWLDTTK